MSFIAIFSNLISVFYFFRSGQLALRIGRNWRDIRAEPLTREKHALAEQAAFFISVPPSVLIHELFHALAIWLFGGQVVEFAYRVFWGYVVPAGEFSPVQMFFIGLSGTLGSLLFGLAIWLALRHNPSRTLRYFGLRSFRFQIYFSLLYYPLISLVLPIGDWRIIYSFTATPYLSIATLLIHAGLLLVFWRADRQGWFEMPAFDTVAAQTQYEGAQRLSAAGDPQAELQVIETLRYGGAGHQARHRLEAYLQAHPNSADALLIRALMGAGGGQIDSKTAAAARQALDAGLSDSHAAYAHEMLARYHLSRNEWAAAEAELTAALADDLPLRSQAQMLYSRSQALRHQGRLDEAMRDSLTAVAIAESVGDTAAATRYQQEVQVVAKHGGVWPISDSNAVPQPPPGD
jgi:tetratricopeptide (TPR) repeat protein